MGFFSFLHNIKSSFCELKNCIGGEFLEGSHELFKFNLSNL